jgi:hypothetical protein
MKGQGATEYLVLLAAVLIIALVSLALLGFFPGMAGDAKISQSHSYWSSEAKPFAVVESSMTTDGNLTIVLELKEANGAHRLTNFSTDPSSANSTLPAGGKEFNAGERKTFVISGFEAKNPGEVYEVYVNFTYLTPNKITTQQYGVKPIMGKVG